MGDFDWYQEFVGPVSYLTTDQAGQGSKRLVVASEGGVMAAVNSRTGNIIWRQVFEEGLERGSMDAVLQNKMALLTVSDGGGLIRSWEPATGVLRWETPTRLPGNGDKHYPLSVLWRPGSVQATLAGKFQGSVVVASGSHVASYSVRSGDQQWLLELEEGSSCAVYTVDSDLYVLSAIENDKLIVTQVNASNGQLLRKWDLTAPWLSTATTSCVMAGSSVVCLEESRLDLYTTQLDSGRQFTLTMLPSLGISREFGEEVILSPARSGGVWLQAGHSHWLLGLQGEVTIETKLDHTLLLEEWLEGEAVEVRVHYGGEGGRLLEIECRGEGKGGVVEISSSVKLEEFRGKPLLGSAYLFHKSDKSLSYRLALRMQDGTLLSLQHPGHVTWQREEALATIVTLQMLDLPAGESEITESFVSLAQTERNPIKLAVKRLQLQAMLAKEFLYSLQAHGLASLLRRQDSSVLVRDQFSTRKLLVAATNTGKLYGLDSTSGDVVWQSYFPWLRPLSNGKMLLYFLRSASHPPHPPLAALIGTSKLPGCDGSMLLIFNPLTFDPQDLEQHCIPSVLQAVLLPMFDSTHSRILVTVSNNMQVGLYPATPEVHSLLSALTQQLFLFLADSSASLVSGYQLEVELAGSLVVSPVWQLQLPTDSERILSITTKPPNEHVNSQGRVKTDRSVQYKYLNPHLFAMVTESTDSTKPFISVYLVDAVTGSVIHHTTHRLASGPVSITHSENWIVYHYYNSKLRRYELAVLEIHESSSNLTHSLWSSLTPPPPPEVTSQAYTFGSALSALTATQTMRGITHKAILLGLHSGHIASIPKHILDPRRQLHATDEMREEGLPPYIPDIAVKPVHFINYNQTVTRLRDIYTAPSGLESTSLVLACGLDLYFTRVVPSKQFDLLPEDFDFTLVAAVVGALVAATFVLSRLSRRKLLKLIWK